MKFLPAATLLFLSGTASAFEVTSTSNSLVPQSTTAEYSCTLTNLWSAATQPVGYPGGSAHWTDPVLAAHSSGYTMWAPGQTATTGIENVAELGSTGSLRNELNADTNVKEFVVGDDQFNNRDPPQTLPTIEVDSTNRLLSVITMVAPSPDWFTGFYNFEPANSATGAWYREFTIDSFPWDAGTENGGAFVLGNTATSPRGTIFELTVDTVPSSGAFLNQAGGDTVLPLATWTCNLETPDPPQVVCFSGEMTVEVQSKGTVSMQYLEVGDKVKVDNDTFEPVYGFGHKSESKKTSYLQIHGKNAGQAPLEISKDHMVFVVEEATQKAVPVSMVKVGDTLLTGNDNFVKVSKIKNVERDGAFAPFTMSGTIVVNGIVSSSYVSLQDNTDTLLIAGVDTHIGWHTVAHVCTTPFRLAALLGLLPSETYNDEGVSKWIEGPHRMALYVMNESHALVTLLALVGLAAVMAPLFLAEQVLTTPIIGAGLAAALYWWSRQSKKTRQL